MNLKHLSPISFEEFVIDDVAWYYKNFEILRLHT